MNTETFEYPLAHIIDVDSQRVVRCEHHIGNRWFNDGEIIPVNGQRYTVVRQQVGVHHYYVFARREA